MSFLASVALCAATATASATPGSYFALENANSRLCMSVPGDNIYEGALVNQYTCGWYPDQYWFTVQSDSHPGWYYTLPRQDSTLCVTYTPNSTAQLSLQWCGLNAADGNTNTQLWNFNRTTLEMSTFQGWSMSVPGANKGVAPINIYPYGDYPDQSWYVVLLQG
ncbi:RICIN domain-containing protein [Streptomyces sp. FXJ1.172]|nr:RICIN domain-containing protein [Streptomyces sp. FXJ1.172]WEO99924.1 RICIN domain-containing protein [Streptomyces sp. FXJ1.172]